MRKPRDSELRRYHHGDLRRAVVTAALEILSETQSMDFSLRELARRAGVSHNAPYKHFAEKSELLAAVSAAGFDLLTKRIADQIARVGNPRAQLFTILRTYIRFGVENPALYRLMFGGTDWDATPDRYREPNAMATRIAMRMGNEMACIAVPQDLAIKDPAGRKMFRNVTVATTPEAGGEATIRTEIKRLHRVFLNEDLADDSAELQATYKLWDDSHKALVALGKTATAIALPTKCRAIAAFAPGGAMYPDATHDALKDDPNATVRAWMAVVAYMLSDGRFFLQ